MGKKRRVWRIVGGVVCLVCLVAMLLLLMAMENLDTKRDARIERALAQIIAEQGFESKVGPWLMPGFAIVGGDTLAKYEGAPISQENELRVVAQLREACPGCWVNV